MASTLWFHSFALAKMNYQPSLPLPSLRVLSLYIISLPSPLFHTHRIIFLYQPNPSFSIPSDFHAYISSITITECYLIFPYSQYSHPIPSQLVTQLQPLVSAVRMFMTSIMILLCHLSFSHYSANVSLPHVHSDPHSNLPGNHYLLHAGQIDLDQVS